MLVGVGGSGKQCIASLGAFAAECEVFQIVLSRGYNESSFREDLKQLFTNVGVKNQKTCFIFKAAQVRNDAAIKITINQPELYAFRSYSFSTISFFHQTNYRTTGR